MQVFISLIVMGAFVGFLIWRYMRSQAIRMDIVDEETLTPSMVLDKVDKRLADIMKSDYSASKTDVEYRTYYNRRMRIERAMTNCIYGIDKDKIIVKELITSILQELFPTLDDLYKVYPLNAFAVEPSWQFEILMERLYQTHKKNALPYLIDKYQWAVEKYTIEAGQTPSFNVTVDQLQEAYDNEIIDPLSFREALAVVATLIYRDYKGMGIVDTLRTMNIDGFNFGTSGSIMNTSMGADALEWRAPRSVWVYYHGKYIHFQFLTFNTEAEVRRVVQLIARYNNPGALTEKRGYLVNTMYDKSRVLALRPPASEYWAVFVRKFTLSSVNLHVLIDPQKKDENDGHKIFDEEGNPVSAYKNAQLPEMMINMLMLGQVTCAFTGRQGSGKTTMMTAAISPVDARFNIRVLEMAPEMYLRELYPQRNILSVQETSTVTAAELQDALKKSDAALSIVGEVATDVIAARMIQMGQVASIFTIFSHHANRPQDLIHALTNSVVAASGGSATPATVEPQVIDVVKVDVHLDYDVNGHRYIERITEIMRADSEPYPERRPGEPIDEYQIRLNKEYYKRQTDRETFRWQDIIHFNYPKFTYEIVKKEDGSLAFFSKELTKHIFSRIPTDQQEKWRKWVFENWGKGS